MSVLIAVLLYLILAVAALLAAVLMTPFGIKFEVISDGSMHWKIRVQPFGSIGPKINIPTAGMPKEKPPKPHQRAWRRRIQNPRRIAGAGARLVTDLLGTIRFRNASVDVRFGCNDPADTGLVFGMLTPVLYGTSGLQRASLNVVPVFDQAIFVGRVTLDVAIIPIKLLPPVIRFGWQAFRASQ